MALKAIVDSLDNVEEAAQPFYKEQDGKYVLDVDETVKEHPQVSALQNAYKQEQDKRRKAADERDELKKKLDQFPEDFDPDEFERLKASGDPNEDVQKRVEEARERERKRHEKTIEKLTAERDDLAQRYHGTRVESALKDTLNEVNVSPHLRRAAERLWSADVQLDDEGNVVTKDGTPIGDAVKEWSESDEGKHFIAAAGNGGGGAPGGRNSGGGGKDNPWSKEGFNLTEQMRIANTEPERAKRLKAEAGAA